MLKDQSSGLQLGTILPHLGTGRYRRAHGDYGVRPVYRPLGSPVDRL
jgi:hypothetical protein